MRPEIENWWEQAKIDFSNAEMNYNQKAYYVCVFLCQQAVEKGLKAYFMIKKRESPGVTHSLIYLATQTKIPSEFIDFLGKLAPEFVATRYPDVTNDIPARVYTENIAKEILEKTRGFMKWLKEQI